MLSPDRRLQFLPSIRREAECVEDRALKRRSGCVVDNK
jgi:hypothetical protein